MKEKIINILKRFESKGTWVGIASILLLIITTAGVDINSLTSWSILWDSIVKIVSNPATLISIIGSIWAFLNNPTDKTKF